MRRKDKEITEPHLIETIIRRSRVCRLALSDGRNPYVVPVCFGYADGTLYIHSALEGKKIEMLRKNNRVCFEFDSVDGVVEAEKACGWSMKYQSVIGFGKASFVDDVSSKKRAVAIIAQQYTNRLFDYPDKTIAHTTVIRIDIDSLTGKHSG